MLTCEDLSPSLGLKTRQTKNGKTWISIFLDDLPHLIKHHSPKNRNMLWKNLHKLSITCVCGIFWIPTITKPSRYLNGTLLTYIKIANYKFQGSSILGTCKFLVKQTSSTKLTKNIWSLHTFSTKLTIQSVNHHEKPTILGNAVWFPNQHFPSKTEANHPLPPFRQHLRSRWMDWRRWNLAFRNSREVEGEATKGSKEKCHAWMSQKFSKCFI